MTVRVILADDDEVYRLGMSSILSVQHDIEIVAEAADGAAALEAVREHHPDVAVLDLRMPVLDGVETTREIASDATTSAVGKPVAALVLTGFHVTEAVYDALRAGASGYVLKDRAGSRLVPAVRAVAEGEAWLDPGVTRDLIAEFARRPDERRATPDDLGDLTRRERDVLVLVAHGLSNGEIADHLTVEMGTVKTHVNRIFTKLGLEHRAQAVSLAYRTRLVDPDDARPDLSPGS
ncbi:response regulator transcription factor [Actinomycetospora sp. OC33-EN08]|uniref:Response regulator transcription factor n=1 Tax=Actinomycetospora aurantiaca TaxID=3129233 RepID=A0ABU8MUG1_9PSEU